MKISLKCFVSIVYFHARLWACKLYFQSSGTCQKYSMYSKKKFKGSWNYKKQLTKAVKVKKVLTKVPSSVFDWKKNSKSFSRGNEPALRYGALIIFIKWITAMYRTHICAYFFIINKLSDLNCLITLHKTIAILKTTIIIFAVQIVCSRRLKCCVFYRVKF